MATISVDIDQVLAETASTIAQAEGRTMQQQLEFWIKLGRAALDNPDLPASFIAESLMSLSAPREEASPFR
jgi:hypothetical protein